MAGRETSTASEDLDRRQFLTVALAAAASSNVVASAAMAVENSSVEPRQNLVAYFEGWNVGLITAHRPELTPAENRVRMGELRADIGNRFGLLQVRGRYMPKPGAELVDEYAFLIRSEGNAYGELKGVLRKLGTKFNQDAVVWKDDRQDAVLFALRELLGLGLTTGDKKSLGRFRTNRIRQYHAILAGGWGGSGEWEDLGVWTISSFFNRQPRRLLVDAGTT